MRSAEAERLAASVVTSIEDEKDREGGGGGGNSRPSGMGSWNSMSTKTQVDVSDISDAASDTKAASQKLVGGNASSNKAKSGSLNIDDPAFANDADPADDDDEDNEDEFFDRPLWQYRQGRWRRRGIAFAERLYRRLYGDKLPVSEMLRTLCLASTLFFMIGGYWLFRSLKDPILTALCGVSVIPKAKMLSVVVVLFVVSIYNHFLESDTILKHQLFYIFGTFYSVLFTVIALLLMHPTIGLANQQPSPWRILGWVSYCSIESFGSVMVSLFWSFANSNTSLETAKASYGVMVATAQLGSILGPTLVQWLASTWGPANCYMLGAFTMLLLQVTMRLYIRIYGYKPDAVKKKKLGLTQGIVEGLVLFHRYNYVKGIFAISCLFMVAVTIVDFTLKMLARDFFAEQFPCEVGMSCWDTTGAGVHGMSEQATNGFTSFMGFFGQATNTLSLLLSLFGTSAVIRYLGLRLTLLLFPSLVLLVIFLVRLWPTLYVVFAAMMTLKANSYALNNPCKEILYQPTSPSVKYKAKSWIDIFGARGSKALGSVVTNAFSDSATNLIANGTLVGMCVAAFLIWNATFMGRKFDEYTLSGYVVGADDEDEDAAEQKNVDMASKQNKLEDTSCALDDDNDDEDDDALGAQEEGQDGSEHSNTSPAKVTMV
jgi:ATP:ADP antiporter, AAA family